MVVTCNCGSVACCCLMRDGMAWSSEKQQGRMPDEEEHLVLEILIGGG